MDKEKSLQSTKNTLANISNKISLVNQILGEDKKDLWAAYFISNPRLFRLLISLYYLFSKDELLEFKSKLILGNIIRGVDYPVFYEYEEFDKDDDYYDEDREYYHDENLHELKNYNYIQNQFDCKSF